MTVAAASTFLDEIREQLESEPVRRELARLRESGDREPDVRPLYRELGRLGLLAVNWPEEYGGRGRSLLDAALVAQELVRAGVPDTLHVNTIQIVGLFLLLAGTPEQKARYLPGFASGERFASVLYTEPRSGSDLASLRATAVEDGDGYRLDGTKIFSLKSDITDVGLCAARTSEEESKYAGITLFLVDLHAEGVRRSVIPSIADEQFHRVELHGVHVPREAVVGVAGEGWPLLSKALAIERTGLDYTLKAERWLAAAVDGVGAAAGESLRVAVGRYGAAVDASRLLTWSVLEQLAREEVDEPRTAAAKYYSSELAQDVAFWAAGAGVTSRVLDSAYREAPGLTLSAGTSEVMLQIVTGAALDADGALPEEPEEVRRELRAALRNALEGAPAATDPHAAPATHGRSSPAWPVLLRLGGPQLELPADRGGLELGFGVGAIVCEELGRLGHGSPYAGVALALAAGNDDLDTVAAPAGFEREPLPAGEPATVLAASSDVDVFCVPVRDGLALVGRDELAEEPRELDDGNALISLRPDEDAIAAGLDEVLPAARVRQAAYLLGLAEGAQAEAVRHAGRREQFGQPLRAFQSISFRLADLHVRLETLRLLVYAAADGEAEPADALALAAETAQLVTRTAMQVCGARSLTGQTALHRLYRLVRVEAVRFGTADSLWAARGAHRLAGN
jgi:alkylation response protein AidB-like acyl-CoA dehydrogenase